MKRLRPPKRIRVKRLHPTYKLMRRAQRSRQWDQQRRLEWWRISRLWYDNSPSRSHTEWLALRRIRLECMGYNPDDYENADPDTLTANQR